MSGPTDLAAMLNLCIQDRADLERAMSGMVSAEVKDGLLLHVKELRELNAELLAAFKRCHTYLLLHPEGDIRDDDEVKEMGELITKAEAIK